MDSDDNVTRLPVRFKSADGEERALKVVECWDGGCDHKMPVTYQIRAGETEVECGRCAVKLDPMWVLMQLARRESQFFLNRARYKDEMARLAERSSTACEHCGRKTRISRTKPRRVAV